MPTIRPLVLAACAFICAAVTEIRAAEVVASAVPPLLALNDADRDGRLTLGELEGGREQQLARFDADRDGRLSVEEYGAF